MAGAADLDDESLLIVPKTNGHFYRQKLWWWSERSSFEMYQRSVLLYGITASPCSSGTAFLHCSGSVDLSPTLHCLVRSGLHRIGDSICSVCDQRIWTLFWEFME